MPEYWHCIIGPVERSELNKGTDAIYGKNRKFGGGADSPPRMAAELAITNLIDRQPANNWSGWGLTEKQKDHILKYLAKGD